MISNWACTSKHEGLKDSIYRDFYCTSCNDVRSLVPKYINGTMDFAIASFESHFEGTELVDDEHSHCCSCVIA